MNKECKSTRKIKNGLLINLFCFSSDFDETWWSCRTNVYYDFTKFHQKRIKNKKYLLISHFIFSLLTYVPYWLIFPYWLINDLAPYLPSIYLFQENFMICFLSLKIFRRTPVSHPHPATAAFAELMENSIPQTTDLFNRMYKRPPAATTTTSSVGGSNGAKSQKVRKKVQIISLF